MVGAQDDRRGWSPSVWLGAIAAARLPVLGPWPALRSGSACDRIWPLHPGGPAGDPH
jgi:hypothetical protein